MINNMDEVMDKLRETHLVLPKSVFSLGLTAGELAVYCYLMMFRNYSSGIRNYSSGKCYPRYRTIGEGFKINSDNTVVKYIRGLERKDMILMEPTNRLKHSGEIQNSSLRYTIRDAEEVQKIRNLRELERADLVAQQTAILEEAERIGAHVTVNSVRA